MSQLGCRTTKDLEHSKFTKDVEGNVAIRAIDEGDHFKVMICLLRDIHRQLIMLNEQMAIITEEDSNELCN